MKDQSVGRRPRGLGRITSLHTIPATREGNDQKRKKEKQMETGICLRGWRVQLVPFTSVNLFFMGNAVVAGDGTDA